MILLAILFFNVRILSRHHRKRNLKRTPESNPSSLVVNHSGVQGEQHFVKHMFSLLDMRIWETNGMHGFEFPVLLNMFDMLKKVAHMFR